jgi:hypothetical protein
VAGTSALQADLKVQPAANTQPTANPITAPVGVLEGDTVTLNGSGSDADAVPCDNLPCPTPGPNNFRWTQTGGPPVGDIAGSDTSQASFVVPDNGSYSFQLEVNDGTTPFFSASTQSVNFNVGSVAPTPKIDVRQSGQSLTSAVVSGGSAFSLAGSSTDPAPSDPDASRTYSWTRTGGDCAAFGTFPAAGKTVNLTAPSPGSDCTAQFQLAVTDKDAATGTSNVTVTVKPAVAGRIGGVVRSCDGTNPCAPLGGAFAVLYKQNGSLAFIGVQQTAGDGSFAFDGLAAGNYRVFFTANGHTSEWLGGGSVAGSSPLVTPGFLAANADLAVKAGGTGSIGGNVTLSAGGNAPNGTSVRLYNSAGFVSKTTTSGGSYSFPELKPRDDYKVLFGMGLPDYQMEWYTGQYNEGLANRLTVNPGGNTAANLQLRKPVTNTVVQTGTATSGTATAILDTGATWVPNAFAGMRITLTGGTGSGQVRTIVSNTAEQINVSAQWTTNPANGTQFSIAGLTDATANGVLRGWVTRQDTAGAVQPFAAGPPPVGIEARVYQADTGAYVGRVNVGSAVGGPNYSFESWVANTSLPNVSGLKPGSYKVLFRNVGQLTNGTHPYCSEWSGDVRGGTASGSWQFAEPVTVTGGQYTRLDAALAAAASCVAPLN